jgi:hypothetical protein
MLRTSGVREGKQGDLGRTRPSDPESTAKMPMSFDRFLRTDSVWCKRVWVFFWCAQIFCTAQAVPSWSHPDWHFIRDPRIYYGIIGVCGGVAGPFIARYRLPGMLTGAMAGISSVLTTSLVLEPIHSFSRIVLAMTGLMGLLPGAAFYCSLHLVIDHLRAKLPNRLEMAMGQNRRLLSDGSAIRLYAR